MSDHKSLHLLLAQRIWQGFSGLVTLILITKFLSPSNQGWYYAFSSFAAIYTIFDLGLSATLLQLSSHLSANLKWHPNGKVDGKNSKIFACFITQSIRIYLKISLLFFTIIIPAGVLFFNHSNTLISSTSETWLSPWILLVTATTLNLLTIPYISILEGGGDIKNIFSLRLINGFIGSICCWLLLILGHNLWAVAAIPATSGIMTFFWLLRSKNHLVKVPFKQAKTIFNWTEEVWPMQWRIGLTSLAWYLSSQVYIPILFYFQGPITAGQMGITLTIINMIGVLAQSWISHQIPAMGKAASLKEWEVFDKLFSQNFLKSIIFYTIGITILCICYLVLLPSEYKARLLPFNGIIGICMISFFNLLIWALTCHLRSFRREPLVLISSISLLLTLPLAVFFANKYSVNEVILSILAIQLIFTAPASLYLWAKNNKNLRVTDL
jgi:O-antigen/teichoic acid export membrane protein